MPVHASGAIFDDTVTTRMGRRTLFLSYAWSRDSMGRDTSSRVQTIAAALGKRGWRVWLDVREHMHGSLEESLGRGLRSSDAVLLCLTVPYRDKLDSALSSPAAVSDNCLRELNAATALRKPVLPLVFEPAMLAPYTWGTVLTMRVGAHLYVDASSDQIDASRADRALRALFGGGPLCSVVLGRARTRRRDRVRV